MLSASLLLYRLPCVANPRLLPRYMRFTKNLMCLAVDISSKEKKVSVLAQETKLRRNFKKQTMADETINYDIATLRPLTSLHL